MAKRIVSAMERTEGDDVVPLTHERLAGSAAAPKRAIVAAEPAKMR
jgi:hypothetical protein